MVGLRLKMFSITIIYGYTWFYLHSKTTISSELFSSSWMVVTGSGAAHFSTGGTGAKKQCEQANIYQQVNKLSLIASLKLQTEVTVCTFKASTPTVSPTASL